MKNSDSIYPFCLSLKSLALIGEGEQVIRIDNGRLAILANTIKKEMTGCLQDFFQKKGIDPLPKFKIFGELTKDTAIPSAFKISSLLTRDPYPRDVIVAAKGTKFLGKIWLNVNDVSLEAFAIQMALLSVQSLKRKIDCEVTFDDNFLKHGSLYKLKNDKDVTRINYLQQNINKLLIAYFVENPHKLSFMHPRAFEEFVAGLLCQSGFEVKLTPETRDGGFDILAVKHNDITGLHTYLIECKRFAKTKKVGVSIVRNLNWVVQSKNATKGLIVTTSTFSKDAIKENKNYKSRICLCDYTSLQSWINSIEL